MPSRTRTTPETAAESTSSSTSSSRPAPTSMDLYGNQAIQSLMAQGLSYDQAVDRNAARQGQNGIVHVGMNGFSADEVKALSAVNGDRGGVKSIRQRGEEQGVLTRGGRKYDFTSAEDAAAYVAMLGVPADKAGPAADLIANGDGLARDELAEIVEVYWQAERGDRDMQRMVLSGHSVGSMIWGDDNGNIPFTTFEELARLFPRAAGQVRHLMVSACYAGGEAGMQQYSKMFPNIESVWGYHDSSPGTWSGAIPHMQKWEKATEDDDASDLKPSLANGTRKGDHVSVWTKKSGYDGPAKMGAYELEEQLQAQAATYDGFLRGDVEVENTQAGPLRDYYNLVQRYLQHPDATSPETWVGRRDQTIRLIFFKVIAPKFANAYGAKIRPVLEKLGLTTDLSKLNRKDAVLLFEKFDALFDANDPAQAEVRELLDQGLVQLNERFVPTNWV
jgi:hypothetical protein